MIETLIGRLCEAVEDLDDEIRHTESLQDRLVLRSAQAHLRTALLRVDRFLVRQEAMRCM